MRKSVFRMAMTFALAVSLCGAGTAQEKTPAPGAAGQISLPWEKFQRLLNLDEDRISLDLDDFSSLMRQTGMRDLPPFAVNEGRVVLKKEDFKKLLKSMEPPRADPALGDFMVTSASYKGVMERETTEVSAAFTIEVLPRRGRKDFVVVPLLRREVALKSVTLDGKGSLLTEKNGYHAIVIAQEGSHRATAVFAMATDVKRGPQSIGFPVPRTPITLLSMEIPFPSVQPEIPSATSVRRIDRGKSTLIEAVLSPTETIQVAWSRIIPETEKGPPKIYADLWQHLSIEDDALRVNATASINVLQNTITGISLNVPEKYQVLDVTGSVVGDWKEKEVKGQQTLDVSLKTPRQGKFDFVIKAERIFEEGAVIAEFDGFSVPGAVREKGYIAVEMKGSAEAKVTESQGLERAAFSELPPQLLSYSAKPLIFAYKYLRHPYRMALDITKHKDLPVISTVIDKASGITLLTEDGKLVHSLTYTVRNTWKQFMEVGLPEGTELWGTYIDGKPVRPTKNEKGKILIPLNRSQSSEGGLAPFSVELIYYQKATAFGWLGAKQTSFAIPDLMMSRVIWSIYLPFDYTFVHFGGTMEKEKIARGINPLFGIGKRAFDSPWLSSAPYQAPGVTPGEKKDIESESDTKQKALSMLQKEKTLQSEFGKNLPLDQGAMVDQLSREMRFNARLEEVAATSGLTTGVMPIRIQVPTTGQVYRFAKQIVSEEPLVVEASYIKDTPFTVMKVILLLIFIYALYLKRDRLKRILAAGSDGYKEHVAKRVTPLNLLFVSGLLLGISFLFLPFVISGILSLVFAGAAINLIIRYSRSRKERKEVEIQK